MIGAGIFVLTGVAAATQAGPAIVLSSIITAVALTFVECCALLNASYSLLRLGKSLSEVLGEPQR